MKRVAIKVTTVCKAYSVELVLSILLVIIIVSIMSSSDWVEGDLAKATSLPKWPS
jgi:hypothetical protein